MLSKCSRWAVSVMRIATVAGFLGTMAVLPVQAAEGDVERGKVLTDTCKGCHALDSYNNVYPTYHVPRIGGQSYEYLVSALTLYREGNRQHATMTAQAASYSDADIRDIAAYIASVTPDLEPGPAIGEAPAAATACKACHGESGIGQIAIYPYLAGQYQDYLEQALQQYRNGARKGPNATIMQGQLMPLSDEDLTAIAAFYARQEGLQSLPMD